MGDVIPPARSQYKPADPQRLVWRSDVTIVLNRYVHDRGVKPVTTGSANLGFDVDIWKFAVI
jgi:hypothetical protein